MKLDPRQYIATPWGYQHPKIQNVHKYIFLHIEIAQISPYRNCIEKILHYSR